MKPSTDTQLVTLYPRQCTGCTRTYKTMLPNSPFCSDTCRQLKVSERQPTPNQKLEPVTIEVALAHVEKVKYYDWRVRIINRKISKFERLNITKLMESDIE